jgi:hypothetical protein
LRPTIQIETALWPLRRPAVERPVTSFVAEALRRPPEIANIACVSILETAADKFVGLTRRARAEIAGLDEPDPTLVRHLHDLHALREHYDPADVVALAREVMLADAEAYGNQFPAYRDNPMRETVRAVEGLVAEPDYARQYAEFLRLMVYGNAAEFAACAATLQNLAMRVYQPFPRVKSRFRWLKAADFPADGRRSVSMKPAQSGWAERSPDKHTGRYATKYVRAANITPDGLALTDLLEMDFTRGEVAIFALRVGDVLLTEASAARRKWVGRRSGAATSTTAAIRTRLSVSGRM